MNDPIAGSMSEEPCPHHPSLKELTRIELTAIFDDGRGKKIASGEGDIPLSHYGNG
jgi:hypothetical protein